MSRKLGYMAWEVDTAQLQALVERVLVALHDVESIDSLDKVEVMPIAVFVGLEEATNNVGMTTINSEGVQTFEDLWNRQISIHYYYADSYICEVVIGVNPLRKMFTGKQVDIAEYVRTFGGRLDSNVYLAQMSIDAARLREPSAIEKLAVHATAE